MQRGDQQTLDPGEKHSFRAGGDGAVIFSISSTVRDTMDEFTNPHVVR
jgi:D-lyxose ketol-isomerase